MVVGREVRGTNGAVVHPRGAVGIVSRTPAGCESHYLIRFPDGFEASLEREQFEILKHFKDRLPGSEKGAVFELENAVIYRCIVGSRAYGLDTRAASNDLLVRIRMTGT